MIFSLNKGCIALFTLALQKLTRIWTEEEYSRKKLMKKKYFQHFLTL
jgi:hypothetical protein